MKQIKPFKYTLQQSWAFKKHIVKRKRKFRNQKVFKLEAQAQIPQPKFFKVKALAQIPQPKFF